MRSPGVKQDESGWLGRRLEGDGEGRGLRGGRERIAVLVRAAVFEKEHQQQIGVFAYRAALQAGAEDGLGDAIDGAADGFIFEGIEADFAGAVPGGGEGGVFGAPIIEGLAGQAAIARGGGDAAAVGEAGEELGALCGCTGCTDLGHGEPGFCGGESVTYVGYFY